MLNILNSWETIDWDRMSFGNASELGESMNLECIEFQYETDCGCDSYSIWAPTEALGKRNLMHRIKAGTAPSEADSCQIDILVNGC